LSEANLSKADLTGSVLHDTDFTDADLTGANVTNAKIGFAELKGAKITQSQLAEGRYLYVAVAGFPQDVAQKFIMLGSARVGASDNASKNLVVELHSDGKVRIKTRIFRY
jgi:uncharacterized protein YjbI with pentapeptide repeats